MGWYELKKQEKEINDFLDCYCAFHDFRLERISYIPGTDTVEVFLKYDSGREGVLLQFTGIYGVGIHVVLDYEADWIYGSELFLRENRWLWIVDDTEICENAEQAEACKPDTTWVEGAHLFWTATDGNGTPTEISEERMREIR